MDDVRVPVPLPDDPDLEVDECRLWIGNLDTRVTEFVLLKIVQRFGELRKFDFLYNKAGPDIGKPRGYCFVSYHTRKNAERALKGLNGKLALSKKMIVRWAHQEKQTVKPVAHGKDPPQPESVDVDMTIQAIEAKLKNMQDTQKDFTLSTKLVAPPGSSKLSIANPENIRNQTVVKPYNRKPKR